MNDFEDFIIENSDIMKRAFENYSKNLKNIEENEELDKGIPILEGQIGKSLSEINRIKALLDSGASSDLNLVNKKLNFISSILEYYKDELNEKLDELENSKKHNVDDEKIIEEEIEKVNTILQKMEFF